MIESPCKSCRGESCMRICPLWADWFRAAWPAVTALFKDKKDITEHCYDGHRKNYYSRNNRKSR